MPFDIIRYRDKYKDFYGDASLEDVAKDAYQRGYHNGEPDFDTWKQSAGIGSILEEDRRQRNPTFEDKLRASVGQSSGNVVKSFLQGGAEGITTELPSMIGGALQFAGSHLPFEGIEKAGKSLKDWAEEKRQEIYGPEIERTGLDRIVYEGTKMLAPSLLPAGVVGTAARGINGVNALLKAGKIAEATAAAKSATNIAAGSTATLFGLSQAQQTKDTAEQTGVDPGLSPYLTGAIESAGEFFGTKYLAKLFRLDESEITKRGAKEFVKDLIKTIGVETGTETGQAGLEAEVEKYSGIRPNANPIGEAIDVIGPTAFMTILTGGLAGVSNKLRSKDQEEKAAAQYIEKLKAGAMISMDIDEGLKTGKYGDDDFTPDVAVGIIKEAQNSGIFDDTDLDRFKEKYPQLRDSINGLITENVTKKIDESLVNTVEQDVPGFEPPDTIEEELPPAMAKRVEKLQNQIVQQEEYLSRNANHKGETQYEKRAVDLEQKKTRLAELTKPAEKVVPTEPKLLEGSADEVKTEVKEPWEMTVNEYAPTMPAKLADVIEKESEYAPKEYIGEFDDLRGEYRKYGLILSKKGNEYKLSNGVSATPRALTLYSKDRIARVADNLKSYAGYIRNESDAIDAGQRKYNHKDIVRQAIAEGKITEHPDYPELKKAKLAPNAETKPTQPEDTEEVKKAIKGQLIEYKAELINRLASLTKEKNAAKSTRETGRIERLISATETELDRYLREKTLPQDRIDNIRLAHVVPTAQGVRSLGALTAEQAVQQYKDDQVSTAGKNNRVGSWDLSAINNYADRILKPYLDSIEKYPFKPESYYKKFLFRNSKDDIVGKARAKARQTGLLDIAYDKKGNPFYALKGTAIPEGLYSEAHVTALDKKYNGWGNIPESAWEGLKNYPELQKPAVTAGTVVTIPKTETEEVIKGTNPEVRELVLHEMRSGLETGTPGGLQGQDESGNPVYAKSGYPEWFSDIVKKYGNKKTSPTGEKESINAKYLANIITKGLKSDKLTSKQSIIWEDVNKIADHESGKTYAGIVNQFEKVKELQNETREQLAKEEIDAGEIAESKDDLVSGTSEILETEGYSPEQLEAAHTEIASFFDEMSKESYITKQPWEQTREEFVGDATGDERAIRLAAHAQHVKQAVANGEKVSLEVLNHYKNNVWAQIAIDKIKSKGDVQTELEGTDSFNLANQAAPRGMGEKIKEVIPTGNLFAKEEKNIIPYSKDLKITNLDILPKGIGARYLLTVKGNNEDYIAKAWKKAVPVTMGKNEVLIDFKPETKTEVQTAKDINQEIVTSLQEISDKITDIYKVPKISIQITTAKGKGAASYNTWRVKGGKINNARDITIYNYDNIKNSKGEIIHKLSHELAHHISNSLYGSLKHDNRQGGLEDDIGSYISTKLREMIKTEKEILESKTKDVSFQRGVSTGLRGFFSQLEKVVTEKLTEMPSKVQSIPKWLERQNVKPAEMKWMGVEQWLDDNQKDGKIDKQAFADFVRANQIEIQEVEKGSSKINPTKFSSFQTPGGENYRELLLTIPKKNNINPTFESAHWDEPNVLMHVRMNDRVDADGNRVLFLEEVQSDWHQEGRKKGYQTNKLPDEFIVIKNNIPKNIVATHIPIKKPANPLVEFNEELWDVHRNDVADLSGIHVMATNADEAIEKVYGGYKVVRKNNLHVIVSEGSTQQRAIQNALRVLNKVPPAPFADNWHELVIKRMLQYASKNGYDKLAWTTADLEIKKYGTDRIAWKRYDENGWTVSATELSGGQLEGRNLEEYAREKGVLLEDRRDVKNKENLREVLTKALSRERNKEELDALTDKIWKQMQAQPEGVHMPRYEGMKSFYDEKIPNFMNRYVKQWGAKVGKTKVKAWDNSIRSDREYSGPEYTLPQLEDAQKVIREHERRSARDLFISPLTGEKLEYSVNRVASTNGLRDVIKRMKEGISFKQAATEYAGGATEMFGGKSVPVEKMADVHSIDITPAMRESVMQGQPMFKTGKSGTTGLRQTKVQSVVDLALEFIPHAPKVNVVQSNQDCPESVQGIMEEYEIDDAMGFTHNGEVYLISDNLRSTDEIFRTLAHELTHSGLGKFFQRQTQGKIMPIRMKYEALMDAIYRAHDKEVEQLVKTTHTHLNIGTVQGRRQACEEWLCNQTYESQPKWYDKLVAVFHDLLRAVGLDVKLSDAEVRVVLQDAFKEFGGEGVNFKIAHHGTPHIWMPEPGFPHGRPRLDKIGTGEGVAAFGWGWYSAEAEGVGEEYRKQLLSEKIQTLSEPKSLKINGERIFTQERTPRKNAALMLNRLGGIEAIRAAEDNASYGDKFDKDVLDSLYELINSNTKIEIEEHNPGSLYKLEIPDDVIPKLLDWDKQVGHKIWVKILTQMRAENRPEIWHDSDMGKIYGLRGNERGYRIYSSLSKTLGSDKAASNFLARAGIPGNKYLDWMSRNGTITQNKETGKWFVNGYGVGRAFDSQETAEKELDKHQSRNYVIWDQKVLDRIALLERNGEKLDAIREEQEQEVPIEFQRSPVRRSQPMFSRSDNPDYKWWEGMNIKKQIESLPFTYWQKPRDFIALGYVPITRSEADELYYAGLDKFVAHVNIKGDVETTGNEGLFMRPLSFYGYQYWRYDESHGQETKAKKRYSEYRERYLQGNKGRETVPVSEEAPELKVAETKFQRQNSDPLANHWNTPEHTRWDDFLYNLADKNIDAKDVVKAIRDFGKTVSEETDVKLKETNYSGRLDARVKDFLSNEFQPVMKALARAGISREQFEEFLLMRHAKEANAYYRRNKGTPDGGSGVFDAQVDEYFNGKKVKTGDYVFNTLTPELHRKMMPISDMIDRITHKSAQILIDYGVESQNTIGAWFGSYQHYVPLSRDDDPVYGRVIPTGFSVSGPSSARRQGGSEKPALNILSNIAAQREKYIKRGEKNIISKALYSLAQNNPNPEFWEVVKPQVVPKMNVATGETVPVLDESYKKEDMVIMSRQLGSDGEIVEKGIRFNKKNDRAARMALALKNLDLDSIGTVLGTMAKVTRYMASINTQYNPVFGITNFFRDLGTMAFNLSTTPIAGKQAQVLKGIGPAMMGISKALRGNLDSPQAKLFKEFQMRGGQTGYVDLYKTSEDRTKDIDKQLKMIKGKAPIRGIISWAGEALSNYNNSIENAVRLSAYEVGIANGMSKDAAAAMAKDLTVNFNRKGQWASQAGAMYAFFNASVQGSMRMYETLKGPKGRKIIAGGLIFGAVQALALAAAGFDDDEPPDFVRERNIIIPIGGKQYITIPMPLGFNIIPSIGRIPVEIALAGGKGADRKVGSLFGIILEAFNPLGSSGVSLQTFAPTIADPFVALAENKDWTGKPIYKENFNSLNPAPGHAMAKDTASLLGRGLSYALNIATGGSKYIPGYFSPTPDQIDYLAGQATGGIGRELSKTSQMVQSMYSGEELPTYKIPVASRFYGNAEGTSNERRKFYDNVKKMNMHERELKGLQSEGRSILEYLKDNPEARLFKIMGKTENLIRKLEIRRDKLKDMGASPGQIRRIDDYMTARMKRVNDVVERVEK